MVMKEGDLSSGMRSRTLCDGGSVASASAANVFSNQLIHIKYPVVRLARSLEPAADGTKAGPMGVKVIVM
jgi:hypothetical protein